MSNLGFFGRRQPLQPSMPTGEVLGTYETYPEAQSVVDRLAKGEFTVANVAIVGNDLKTVERVTGRLSYARAALGGALSGLWLGLFVGVVLLLFAPTPAAGAAPLIAAPLIAAAFGMFFSLVTYSIERRRRDFTSTTQVIASNYHVIVAPELLEKARDVLARTPADVPPTRPTP